MQGDLCGWENCALSCCLVSEIFSIQQHHQKNVSDFLIINNKKDVA